jgi:NACalpha-BTF3-like transcription factor
VQISKQQLDQTVQLSIQIENEKKNFQNLIKDETQVKQLYREWKNTPATKSLNVFVELIAKKYNVSNDAALTALKTFNWIPSN